MVGQSRQQNAEIRSYFDAAAHEYLRERERQPSFVSQRDLVLAMLPGKCGRILDVGCGPAIMAPQLLERAQEVWGIDTAERMIRLGSERARALPGGERVHLRVGNLERLEFSDETFDAVLAMGVLEYVLDRPRALAEIRRALKPGGAAIITVPNRLSAYHLGRSAWAGARRAARRALGRPLRGSERFVTDRCIPSRFDRELDAAGLAKVDGRFCNFIFFPLHELAPAISCALNRRLSPLASGTAAAWLGTQYVVKAICR